MTTAHPRDPRLRRAGSHRRDPLDAAVRLEGAVDEMRLAAAARGPAADFEDAVDIVVDVYADHGDQVLALQAAAAVDPVTELAADVVTTAQLGTVEPPLTAAEFAAALEPDPESDPELPTLAELYRAEGADFLASVLEAETPPPVFSSERRLTWRSRHDERSRLFGVRDRLAGSSPISDHLWPTGPVLDQGAEGSCVGCGVVHAVNSLRLARAFAAGGDLGMLGLADAVDVYERAQELDVYPGEDYTGTSVLAGMQAAVEYGLIGGYLWAFGTRDIAQAVLQRGPVIVGVPWLSGMHETGPGGLVELAGEDVGAGHVLAIVGIRRIGPQGQPGPYFVWQNSWGPDYGDGGLGYIHHRHLAELLRGVGEAAIPTRDAQAATS